MDVEKWDEKADKRADATVTLWYDLKAGDAGVKKCEAELDDGAVKATLGVSLCPLMANVLRMKAATRTGARFI